MGGRTDCELGCLFCIIAPPVAPPIFLMRSTSAICRLCSDKKSGLPPEVEAGKKLNINHFGALSQLPILLRGLVSPGATGASASSELY